MREMYFFLITINIVNVKKKTYNDDQILRITSRSLLYLYSIDSVNEAGQKQWTKQ